MPLECKFSEQCKPENSGIVLDNFDNLVVIMKHSKCTE